MKPTIFFCSSCDFSGSSRSCWGSFKYHTNEDEVLVNTELGICYNCDRITPVEKLPSPQFLNELKKSKPDNYLTKKLIKEEEKRLQLLSKRKSKGRCLECGSHDYENILNFRPQEEQNHNREYWDTSVTHKNCGGKIYAKLSPANLFMGNRFKTRCYNINGIELTKL